MSTRVSLTLILFGILIVLMMGCAERRAVCEVQTPKGPAYVSCTGRVFWE